MGQRIKKEFIKNLEIVSELTLSKYSKFKRKGGIKSVLLRVPIIITVACRPSESVVSSIDTHIDSYPIVSRIVVYVFVKRG